MKLVKETEQYRSFEVDLLSELCCQIETYSQEESEFSLPELKERYQKTCWVIDKLDYAEVELICCLRQCRRLFEFLDVARMYVKADESYKKLKNF